MSKLCLFPALIALVFWSFIARANPPVVEVLGGISTPAPGIGGSVGLCWQVWRLGCAGVSLLGSRNEITNEEITANASFLTGTLEQGFALSDDYHFVWIQAALGASYYRRKMTNSARPDDESWQKFGPGAGGGFGVELPIADLVGFRFGVVQRKALMSGTSAQVAFVTGVRFGSEWLGVSD